jgi:hypothetical protein
MGIAAAAFTLLVQPVRGAVLAPPTITKAFAPPTIAVGGTSMLSITLANPNGFELTGVAVSDTFPAGVAVASSPSAMNTCGGTLTASANATSISLSGGTLAASGSCAFSVDVTATSAGTKVNTTGNVTSTNTGPGDTATASLLVEPPPYATATATVTQTPTQTASATPTNTGIPQGGACTSPSQCATGFCADGACCDSACSSPLEQCNVAGQIGTCTSTAAPAPALAPWNLAIAALMLVALAGIALYRRV